MQAEVYSLVVSHQEGEFASLVLEIRNPRVGLLNDDREQWAWLSWRKPDNSVVPLFHGRLVGIPSGIDGEVIKLTFLAKPADFEAQKEAVAQSLRVDPYWDPVWLSEGRRTDPDAVLEARPQLWHIGRTDKIVTASHIITGEAGTISVGEDEVFADSVDVNIGADPIRRVSVEATVDWKQTAEGVVDLAGSLMDAFAVAGSHRSHVSSYTGQGLEASWPFPFDAIGGGWSVFASDIILLSGDAETEHWLDVSVPKGGMFSVAPQYARVYLWEFRPVFSVAYEAERARTEVLSFELSADVQDIISESDEAKVQAFKISSSAIAEEVDGLQGTFASTVAHGVTSGLEMPIGSLRHKSYFNQDRGKRSLRWLLALARTKLMYSARCVQVSFEINFELAVTLSCRHSMTITDNHLPGGQANGKVVGYSFSMNDKGAMIGSVVLGCSIGKGNSLSFDDGDPSYVDDGYVNAGWQYYINAQLDLGTGDVGFHDYNIDVDDDGVDFFNMTPSRVIENLVVLNGQDDQEDALEGDFVDTAAVAEALNAVATVVELTLKPVKGGPFTTQFPITVTDLMLAKTIDLEAAA